MLIAEKFGGRKITKFGKSVRKQAIKYNCNNLLGKSYNCLCFLRFLLGMPYKYLVLANLFFT
jgi:hypothetical protein